jgi:PKD repeat protein/sugar lactone lactonase YvrE
MFVAFLSASICGWSAGEPAAAAEPAVAEDGDTEVLLETSFETVFPRLPWRVEPYPEGAAEVTWGRTDYRATEGRYSIYCAGMGPAAPGDGGPAPVNTASWAIVGPYDLTETTAGTLSFNLWLSTEPYQDVFMWLVSTDGENYSGSARSTSTNGWQTVTANLENWGAAGNVIGESAVWIAFVYQSDHSNAFEGAYLDEVSLTVDLGSPADEGKTYTSNADFALGTAVGLESTANQLELTDAWDALPFLWVPNSVTGTVSKIDAVTGGELGRYRVDPSGDADPGVAAVDFEGSCWVGNRGVGTLVKIGLLENGGCVDSDGSGKIETSRDLNSDGDISGSEILDWGDDECVLIETVLVEGAEGPHVPGDGHDDYEANNLQAVAVDANGNVWAGVYDTSYLYRIDGGTGVVLEQVDVGEDQTSPTAAVIAGDGTLWVSSWPDRWVLAIETTTGVKNKVDLPHVSNGVAVNRANDLFVTGYDEQRFSKIDAETTDILWTRLTGSLASGIATTENGRIWLAASGANTVNRYTPEGQLIRFASVIGGPTGVAVDQDGKIWVAGSQTDTIYRIDPLTVFVDLQKVLVGTSSHNATGDFTGIVARNLTSRFGTWTVVYDSQVAGTPWGVISWQAQNPDGTVVAVRVRSSEDEESWSAWEPATTGEDLSLTPPGRYLEIQASLQKTTGDEFPQLEELTVVPASVVEIPVASYSWSPQTPTVGLSILFSDTSTGEPTLWAWDFGDGATSVDQNPSHVFMSEGTFDVALTATNEAGSDNVSFPFTVGPAADCVLICTATVPATVDLGEQVSYEAAAQASNCTGTIAYSWVFGDGATSDAQNPTYTYSSTGTLRWGMTAAVDNASCTESGDITVSGAGPNECSLTYWVPVVSLTNGANGSVWQSDLGLLGTDPAGAAVELRFHASGSSAARVVTVAPDAMVNLVDVVTWLDSSFSGSGALEICSDGELVVDSRTYNVLASDHTCFPGGTFGQHLAGDLSGAGLAVGESARLGQLRESAAFRTNLGFVNTGTEPATVEVFLLDATGVELLNYELELESERWLADNRPFFKRAGREDLDAASAKVTVISGDGIVVYASVIDNLTNDATTVPMR